ncbi:type VI secretion system Vgr family protein [Paraburkholderia sp.]|uniref:type VI secretion system Vgr family protein n=1 Tax=Paraburkholderia sp. TaxID=1926495 RepID=UPI0039E4AC35
MTWDIQTRSIGFTCPALPEMVSRSPGGEEFREPMLATRRIKGCEAVGELFEYLVVAESQPDFLQNPVDAAQIDLEAIVGTHGTVAIELTGIGTFRPGQHGNTGRANIGADTRYISGEIASARIRCVEDRAVVYEFVLRPFVWRATQNCDSRIFSGSVTDVLREVLAKYAGMVEWRIRGPAGGKGYYPPRAMVRQAWESDWTFALRLMEEWGLVFWFEHRQDFHSLVISDSPGGFQPHGIAYETLRYHTGSRIDEEHISELAVTYTVTAGQATVNDHNYMQPRLGQGREPNREEYEDASGTASREIEIYAAAGFAQPEAHRAPEPHDMREEGRHLARVKLQAARCGGRRANGKGCLRGLQPGRTFTLVDYPQASANREYTVLACELDITEAGTSTGTRRTYTVSAEFELHPVNEPYRMPQATPKPRVEGYEYAVIVAPQDHEMWIDYRNCLFIQFDWDRRARFDGATSIWVRAVTQWQGSELGVVTPGRAGQMVVVSHVHGDPDRPVISGFVVDRFNTPPWELPANAALSGMRSRSLEHGVESNHLALDDTPGRQQAQLASDHAKSGLSLGFITRIDGNKGRQDARGEGFELRTDRWGVLRAARGLLATTFARSNAAGKAKDMSETHAHLTEARGIHEHMAQLARRHGAQDATDNQGNVAKAIRDTNAALRGNAAPRSDDFPELENPDIAISSAANVHMGATASTHIASREHTALTTGGNVAIAALKSLYASVGERIALFASKAITVLTPGRVRVESQTDDVELIARKVISILSEQDEIRLTAKRIVMNGGGTQLTLGSNGILGHTAGAFLVHATSHATERPLDVPVKAPMTDISAAKIAEPFALVDNVTGLRIANQPYRITLEDGQIIKGMTNDAGETALVLTDTPQFATVEVYHNDGTDNPIGIFNSLLTQHADVAKSSDNTSMPPSHVSEKRSVQRVGSRDLKVNDDSPSSSGHGLNYALCQPYNWGMRYSTRNSKNPRQLEFPVAKQFALDLYSVLVEKIQWGSNYYGNEKDKSKNPEWVFSAFPLGETNCNKLALLIAPVIQTALTTPQSGAFALPVPAVPTVVVTDAPLVDGAKGTFSENTWTLTIATTALVDLFKPYDGSRGTRLVHVRKQLQDLTDTIFHETRHCQQYFWVFAMMQQQVRNFPDTPNIARFPAVDTGVQSDAGEGRLLAQKVVELTASHAIPADTAALTGIKQMAVAIYVEVLAYWRLQAKQAEENSKSPFFPSFAPDRASLENEYERAYRQAQIFLTNAGAGGTPVDVDKMVDQSQNGGAGYLSRPWENDAMFCGNIEGDYWLVGHPVDVDSDSQCSRLYAYTYNVGEFSGGSTTVGSK